MPVPAYDCDTFHCRTYSGIHREHHYHDRKDCRGNEVTTEDLQRVVKTHLSPENFVLVIVGDKEAVREELEVIGGFEEVYYQDSLAK